MSSQRPQKAPQRRKAMATELQRQELTTGRWEELEEDVQIPTDIHLDLQKAGKIPDPFLGLNERQVQWIMDSDFTLKVQLPPYSESDARVVLVFEGLDTFATVSIGGHEILKSDNMFISHRVDITTLYREACASGVDIKFESAKRLGDERLEKHGKRVCWNGHYSRVYVRKAQYHYGWDWGPSLVTCGPWRPIYLERYFARLASVDVTPSLASDFKEATLGIKATLEANQKLVYWISAVVTSPTGKEYRAVLNPPTGTDDKYSSSISIPDPDLWYPRQHGSPNMYTVTFTLTYAADSTSTSKIQQSSPVLHEVVKKIGLRRVELIRDTLPEPPDDPLSGGSTFYFRVNNIPIFCGGSNWIPADSFQPRITRKKLQHWLHTLLAKRGNQNMVRVWGGGVYESEDFYELCDEAGVMVWQDVCFACGDYPASLDWFAESIQEEVKQNLERLKWHPSLVLVAGSNEDYQVADEEVGYIPDAPVENWRKEPFPSRWLYELQFPKIVKEVCNGGRGELIGDAGGDGAGVLYWPGSPFGGIDSTDRTVGDLHQWNIWGGIQAPYQAYPKLGGRFISEFGMISLPSLETIKNGFLSPDSPQSELHPQSETLAHHVKAHSFEKRMLAYIAENFRPASNSLDEHVYLSQLVQADAMAISYKSWRERWGGKLHGRSCGGVLVWQMNDCWPVTSWSICDFNARPKAAFYSIARALKPVILSAQRFTTGVWEDSRVKALASSKTIKGANIKKLHSVPHTYPRKQSRVRVALSSIDHRDQAGLMVQVEYINIATGEKKVVFSGEGVTSKANETQIIYEAEVPEDEPTVVYATAVDSGTGELVTRETDWPQPLKFVLFPDRGVDVTEEELEDGKSREIAITVEKPVKGMWFDESDGESWSDNGVDIVPGETFKIVVDGWVSRDLMWRAYGPKKWRGQQ